VECFARGAGRPARERRVVRAHAGRR
jgi:hypothetical protein